MMNGRTIRAGWQAAALALAMGGAWFGSAALAQVSSYGDKQGGENTGDQLPQVLQKVAVTQHLNQPLPLNAAFVDETGKQVVLGDYFGKHPALLSLGRDGRADGRARDGEADSRQGLRCHHSQHRSD
jgi:protein SCO1/2